MLKKAILFILIMGILLPTFNSCGRNEEYTQQISIKESEDNDTTITYEEESETEVEVEVEETITDTDNTTQIVTVEISEEDTDNEPTNTLQESTENTDELFETSISEWESKEEPIVESEEIVTTFEETTEEHKEEETQDETTGYDITEITTKQLETTEIETEIETEAETETHELTDEEIDYYYALYDVYKDYDEEKKSADNIYFFVDYSNINKGYIDITCKDKRTTNIIITIVLRERYLKNNVVEYNYEYSQETFFENETFRLNIPNGEYDCLILIETTILDITSKKMSLSLGNCCVNCNPSTPSEEQIKLVETKKGVLSNNYVKVDTTTSNKGYFILDYIDPVAKDIEIQVESDVINGYGKNGCWYIYKDFGKEKRYLIPLTYGNATYTISVISEMDIIGGSCLFTKKAEFTIKVDDANEKGAFLISTGEVIFNSDMQFIKKANEIALECKNEFEKVSKIKEWLLDYLYYGSTDYTQILHYRVDLDRIYERGTGVCFDFAVILAAMLRSQNIPCKVVVGQYRNSTEMHAWNEVYVTEKGSYTDDFVYLEGNTWCRLDPTYALSHRGEELIEYVLDDNNYIWEDFF